MNAWYVTKKDLRLLARDRRTVFVLVALPLAFISILGLSTGQLFSEKSKSTRVKLGVIDQDQTELSGKLLTEVYRLRALETKEFDDRVEAKRLLDNGKIDVLVVVGPHYHERVEGLDVGDLFYSDLGRLQGHPQNLDIEVEAGSFLANAAEVVQELVFAFAVRTIAPDVLKSSDPKLALKLLVQAKKAARERSEEEGDAAGPTLDSTGASRANIVYQTLVPSYTVMFVFFIVNLMARSFITERDMQTLMRLRIADISRSGLLLGKTVPFLCVSVVQTLLLFIAGKALFGMSWGKHPELLIPVIIATSLAATALGLLVATIVRSESQVTAYGNFLVLIMAGISGCLMPRNWQPELMQQVGLITPHAWSLIAYEQLLNRETPDLAVVGRSVGVLLAFAAGFFAIGSWRYRRAD